MRIYEEKLGRNLGDAFREASRHFEERSAVHLTLHAIARRLDGLHVAYAVAGAMALFAHGHRRFTEDVDLVVPRQDRDRVFRDLIGHGYVRASETLYQLRDVETGVRIDFFPTEMLPGGVAAIFEVNGIKYLSMIALLESKLAYRPRWET